MRGLAAALGKAREPGVWVPTWHSLSAPEGPLLGAPPRPHPGYGRSWGEVTCSVFHADWTKAGMSLAGPQREGRKRS